MKMKRERQEAWQAAYDAQVQFSTLNFEPLNIKSKPQTIKLEP